VSGGISSDNGRSRRENTGGRYRAQEPRGLRPLLLKTPATSPRPPCKPFHLPATFSVDTSVSPLPSATCTWLVHAADVLAFQVRTFPPLLDAAIHLNTTMTSSIPNTAMSRRTHKGPTESARRTHAGGSYCPTSYMLSLTPLSDNQLKSPTIEEALLAFEYADSQGSDTDSYVSTDTDDDEDDEQCPPFGHNSLGRHGT
jgi:hypothetical protein